jgi:uncharacterized protein YyaL (SSP411 family)
LVLLSDTTSPKGAALREQVPLFEGKLPVDGKAAAYVCRNRTCGKPVTSPEELHKALSLE